MDRLSDFVRCIRGSTSIARRDMDAERPSRPRHQHQAELEPEVDEDEPLDLEPL
jgi:hypothetical protein